MRCAHRAAARGDTLEFVPAMARKRSKKKFTAANEARRLAREVAGAPPVARIIPDKRLKAPKHKKPQAEQSDS
jgi:hypothetical protein